MPGAGARRTGDVESEEEFAARDALWRAACAAMRALEAEKKAEKDKKAERELLEKATAPQSYVPGGVHPRPHK